MMNEMEKESLKLAIEESNMNLVACVGATTENIFRSIMWACISIAVLKLAFSL